MPRGGRTFRPAPPDRAESATKPRTAIFRSEGEYWSAGFVENPFRLRDSKGLSYLAQLLRHPDTDFHVLDLVGGTTGSESDIEADAIQTNTAQFDTTAIRIGSLGDAGEMLDDRARAEYRRRLSELREELDEAKQLHHDARRERAEQEIEALTAELSRAVGLGGRIRRAASAAERARQSVTKTIKTVIDRAAEQDPEFAGVLYKSIRTGLTCRYDPELTFPIRWEFARAPAEPTSSAPSPDAGAKKSPATANGGPAFRTTNATTFVGRTAELRNLADAFARAAVGQRRIVFVGGEAGIGKTTVIETFLSRIAAADDLLVGRGQCVEHRGESEPYLPVLDALRGLCQAGGDRVLAAVRRYAPMWLAQMPGLLDDAAFADLQQKVGGAGQLRMLREIAEALEELSTRQVVVLVLEDLHWSDPSTLTMIDWLARRTQRARLFIIGTHRQASALPAEHGLPTLLTELGGRFAQLIAVAPLTPGDVGEYLRGIAESSSAALSVSIDQAARAVHSRTEGNPLFMVTLVNALLPARNGQSGMTDEDLLRSLADQPDRTIPRDIDAMISRQFDRLNADDRQLLELAAVAGVRFSAAALAAVAGATVMEIENRCAALARTAFFLCDAGDEEWPDGTVAATFRFNHALSRDVVYSRLTPARRLQLHLSFGLLAEKAYGERGGEIASQLARHFEQGRDFPRSVAYRELAAAGALKRSAPREAIEHLDAGIAALGHLPLGRESIEQELRLRLALGAALQSTKGYGAPEVEEAYERAGELCRQLGETPQLFPALMGIWSFVIGRGEWARGKELAEKNLRLAQRIQQPTQMARAWRALGHGQLFQGRYEEARANLEQAIALTADSNNLQDTFTYTSNTAVDARSALSWTLEVLGYSDQALGMLRKSMSVAERLENMHDLTYATYFATVLYGFRKEWKNVESWSRRTIELAQEHGLPYFQALGVHMQGAALAHQGAFEKGLPLMTQAIGMTRAMGVEAGLTGMYLMVAEGCIRARQFRGGLDALSEAFQFVKSKQEHLWEPELLRVRGDLLFAQFQDGQGRGAKRGEKDAEECLAAARDLARAQGSQKWELRAALSLGNLWKQQKKKKDARAFLSEAYNRLTEGFESSEAREARDLLDQLA